MLTRIGNTEIWRVLEIVDPFMPIREFFPDMGDAGYELFERRFPHQLSAETGRMIIPIQGFLIQTPNHTVLVDTCLGHDKEVIFDPRWNKRKDGSFLASLQGTGTTPADIDYVFCTHLHVDHVGWNTRLENGRWVPTFPNAKYLFPEADHDMSRNSRAPQIYNESVLPVIEAGQAEFIAPDHSIDDRISLMATPGHTPGHVSVCIEDGGQRVMITGDAMHSPAQCLHPEWKAWPDMDDALAQASRRAFLERASYTGAGVLGTHFPLPSLGRVISTPAGFDWQEQQW